MAAISSLTSAGAAATSDPTAAKASMDKDAFLKLLVAQLQHQDPLKPMEGTEFVTQLAQFTAVEQAIAQSSKLDLLSTQLSGMSSQGAVDLIGKVATVKSTNLAFDGATATAASVNLLDSAESVKVTIYDASGNPVRELDLGSQKAGPVAIEWDGRDSSDEFVAPGSYSFEVTALDKSGNKVTLDPAVSGLVSQVDYSKHYPELVLSNGVRAPVSDVISFEEAPPPAATP